MISVVLLTLLSGLSLKAEAVSESELKRVLKQPLRPTIEENEALLGPATSESPNPLDKQSRELTTYRGDVATTMFRNLPRTIAAFERAFPGGTYYGLGRDVEMLGDAIDAFYRSIGQYGRVKRLPASGTSFPSRYSFNENKALISGFLKTHGLDLDTVQSEFPYVVFDISSWREMSQLRQVGRAAYEEWAAKGRDPKDLYRHFNLIAVGFFFPNSVFDRSFEFEPFFEKQLSRVSASGVDQPVYVPMEDFTYTTAWHELFRTFTPQRDGSVITEPGTLYSERLRTGILWEQFEMRKAVAKPEFLKAVQEEAAKLGFEFPLTRTQSIKLVPKPELPKVEELAEKAKDKNETEKKEEGKATEATTPKGSKHLRMMADSLARELHETRPRTIWDRQHFLASRVSFMLYGLSPEELNPAAVLLWERLYEAYRNKKLTAGDYRHLMAETFLLATPDSALETEVKFLFQKSPGLLKTFEELTASNDAFLKTLYEPGWTQPPLRRHAIGKPGRLQSWMSDLIKTLPAKSKSNIASIPSEPAPEAQEELERRMRSLIDGQTGASQVLDVLTDVAGMRARQSIDHATFWRLMTAGIGQTYFKFGVDLSNHDLLRQKWENIVTENPELFRKRITVKELAFKTVDQIASKGVLMFMQHLQPRAQQLATDKLNIKNCEQDLTTK